MSIEILDMRYWIAIFEIVSLISVHIETKALSHYSVPTTIIDHC